MTNPARFAVWPTGEPPKDHPVPPEAARPLVQWRIDPKLKTRYSTHALCCQLRCNFNQRGYKKVRYEGMGLASAPPASETSEHGSEIVALFDWNCTASSNGSVLDLTLAPQDWNPPTDEGPCMLVGNASSRKPSLFTYQTRSGSSAAYLVELVLFYSKAARDHYVVASDSGKAEATSLGYEKVASLGFVWPPPGTANATSRYGLPSVSKDDLAYTDQNYWRGRIWSPMIQIVYWGLEQYTTTNKAAAGAAAGLVAQSRALLMKEWRGYGGVNSYAGSGRYVYENFGADTGEGYGYSSEAQPMYSWGALAGFIGLQANGFYDPVR
jgi:hypothetical protein